VGDKPGSRERVWDVVGSWALVRAPLPPLRIPLHLPPLPLPERGHEGASCAQVGIAGVGQPRGGGRAWHGQGWSCISVCVPLSAEQDPRATVRAPVSMCRCVRASVSAQCQCAAEWARTLDGQSLYSRSNSSISAAFGTSRGLRTSPTHCRPDVVHCPRREIARGGGAPHPAAVWGRQPRMGVEESARQECETRARGRRERRCASSGPARRVHRERPSAPRAPVCSCPLRRGGAPP
jgi:hypothetical protein